MKPLNVLIARISRGHWERSEIGTWLTECFCQFGQGRVRGLDRLMHCLVDGEPAHCARNSAVKWARDVEADALVMIDNDMGPHPEFFARAVAFLAENRGRAVVVGSPYCGAGPARDVQAFRLTDWQRLGRDEAAAKKGLGLVGAIGTGLFAANLAAFDAVAPPVFEYEYDGPTQERLVSTEDFVFCRKLTEAGGRVWCDWDCWSIHHKIEAVGKPEAETEAKR